MHAFVGRVTRERSTILLCDEECPTADPLAGELERLGHTITVVRSCADAFAHACKQDFDCLVLGVVSKDGGALALPRALGIRRPKLVILVSRLCDRIASPLVRHLGFDAQLAKIVDPKRLDRLARMAMASRMALEHSRAPLQ